MKLAWQTEFYGDRHMALCNTILTGSLNEKTGAKLYGNILPVVQSSGTGKSRVAREAAGQIFSLVVTIREPIDNTGKSN